MKQPVFLIALMVMIPSILIAQNPPMAKAKELVRKMTLEEKVDILVGCGMNIPGMNLSNGPVVGQTMDKVDGAAGTTHAVPRLGIPVTVLADGPAGLRINPTRKDDPKTYYATAFPVGTLLASTWDVKLVEQVGKAMGNEVKEYGVDVFLAPALNIHRNPLGGRNFEYYSEDPVVAGNIAAAMVNGVESNGVGTSVKHFAANNQETNRNLVNSIISERALREIYLKPFEITIKKSQPWTVMSSYNKLNGAYTSEEYDLLTTILRKEWGFKGLVMTDWYGGTNAIAQMNAGNDLLMPGTREQTKSIIDAVKNKQLDVKVINENTERIVHFILQTPAYKKYAYSNQPNLKANAVVARKAASEGMILLKNNGAALPLDKTIQRIAAFGNISYDFISGGSGSGDVNEAYTVSLTDGLANAGYTVDIALKNEYTAHLTNERAKQPKKKFFFELLPPLPEMNLSESMLLEKAAAADVAFITIGRNAGEFNDRVTTNDYYLSEKEIQMIKNVSAVFHARGKKLVVILNVGGMVDVAAWRDDADAILLAWQGGQESGNAVADILSGKVNPSGKLTSTFPISYNDVPSAKSFPGKNISDKPVKGVGGFSLGFDSEVIYDEGIYVGYRYYNTFKVKPAYEFGYGLSYTDFIYSKLVLSAASFDKKIMANITITNTGKAAGKEVVQLYLTAPAGNTDKPSEELKAFAKTGLLKPGQSEKISFTINASDLPSFNTAASSWIADAGTYTIKMGASSTDIKQQAIFKLTKAILVEKCHKVLAPQVTINELKK